VWGGVFAGRSQVGNIQTKRREGTGPPLFTVMRELRSDYGGNNKKARTCPVGN